MVEVYASKLNLLKSEEEISSIMQKVPQWRRNIALKFKMTNDKVRCLAAYLLAVYAITRTSGCLAGDIEIKRNEYGKPELLYPKGCFFNLSHSGNWVVCAIGSSPVGIDVEFIKPTDLGIANRFFSDKEYQYITEQPEETKLDAFYETWTYKECYLKAVGMGLHKPLKSFCVCRDDSGSACVKDDQPQEYGWKLHRLYVDNDYVFAVAGTHDALPVEIVKETALYTISC